MLSARDFCFTVRWTLLSPSTSAFCPAHEVVGPNDSGTNFHSDETCSVSSQGTCNFLASFKHVSILEGESKSVSCSWVNLPGQVWPMQKVTSSEFHARKVCILWAGSPCSETLVGCTCHHQRSRAMFLKLCDVVHTCVCTRTLHPKKCSMKLLYETHPGIFCFVLLS